jgi:hypothetical protein
VLEASVLPMAGAQGAAVVEVAGAISEFGVPDGDCKSTAAAEEQGARKLPRAQIGRVRPWSSKTTSPAASTLVMCPSRASGLLSTRLWVFPW